MRLNYTKAIFAALAGVALVAGMGRAANAQSVTFASFTESDPSKQLFTWYNDGTNAGFNFTQQFNIADPMQFNWGSVTGLPTAGQNVTMTVVGNAYGAAQTGGVLGTNIAQSINNFEMKFTTSGGQVLLDVVSATGTLNGTVDGFGKGTTFTFNATDPPTSIVYSSDFINLSNVTDKGFSFQLTSVNPAIAIASDGYLRAFTASGNGSFNAANVTPVPEPGMVVTGLSMAGMTGLGLIRGRRRRVAA